MMVTKPVVHVGAIVAAATLLLSSSGLRAETQTQSELAVCPSEQQQAAVEQRMHDGDLASLAAFQASASCFHWAAFYVAADLLFNSGKRDDSVRWFYVGQIRGRVTSSFDGGKIAFNALNASLGETINGYAGSDLAKWIADVDWSLEWDKEHPLVGSIAAPGAALADFDRAYEDKREDMKVFRAQLLATDPADLKRQRRENGLD
jgi:hypothetical protein